MTSGAVIGVLAGCGGAGASVFAAMIAGCRAAVPGRPVFLLDCDALGGGLDVLLGCEQKPGVRWAQVRLRGGELDPLALVEALPSWHGVSVLAADRPAQLAADDVSAIVGAAANIGLVVLDVPRWPSDLRERCISHCDRLILVSPAEVRAVTAAAALAVTVDPARTEVVVRGSSRSLPAKHIAGLLGLPLLGELAFDPAVTRPAGLNPTKLRRASRRLAVQAARGLADVNGVDVNGVDVNGVDVNGVDVNGVDPVPAEVAA
ncbi:MAG: helicase/secretion neighborhood CpaE-like protein [Frankiales bacterium]|nr:helicase/secretion neighborhood CpaE-like protein [Frankiales bacterium]